MSDHGRKELSRRELLASGLVAVPVAAGILAMQAEVVNAQPKMAQKLVQYQKTPKKDQKCSICLHFVAPDACKMVEGKIDPNGWCSLYAPKPK